MADFHQEVTLGLNADSAEFCPLEGLQHLLAVGTYQLEEATQIRHGLLYLYGLEASSRRGCSTTDTHWHLGGLCTQSISGIFDMRWHCKPPACLLAACADGSLHLLSLEQHGSNQQLQTSGQITVAPDAMAVSLDTSSSGDQVITSSSAGMLSTIQMGSAGMSVTSSWQAHDLEAWSAAFDRWQEHVTYSGADDCHFKGWDLRQSDASPIFTNRRAHGAGVCVIASSPLQEHCLVTGSYDEHVRMWDTRNPHKPLQVAQVSAGGGVWRLKWHPRDPHHLLAACMHNGFAVLEADAATGSIHIAEEYPHQKTLGYGADWCHLATAENVSIAATCSFYDKLLHVWSPKLRYTHDADACTNE